MNAEEMLIESERAALVKAAVEKILAEGGALNHRTVQSQLPRDFKYDRQADDFHRFVDQAMPELPVPTAAELPTTEREAEPVQAAEDSQPDPEDDGLPLDPYLRGVALREKLRELDQATATARANVYRLNTLCQNARGVMAREIQHMRTKIKPLDAEANARQFIASSQAERQAKADGHVVESDVRLRPGPSVIDRQAFYSTGGTPEDHIRAQHRNGGYRRGALPAYRKGSKLPSDR